MRIKTRDLAVFAMMGALMFASKKLLELVPSVHLLGVFIVSLTVVYRTRALIPIYLYVLLDGLFAGFSTWWIPYLYVWTVLWAFVMLVPKRTPVYVYPIISGLHGLLFGVLYAPVNALIMGLDFKATTAWIVSGLPFDITHGISNLVCGVLIIPFIKIFKKLAN